MTIEQLKSLQLSQEVTVTKTIKEFDLYKRDTLIYLEYHKERESYNFLSVNKKGLTSILHLPPSIHNNIEDSKMYQRLENLKTLGI
jgi:hypothetical protein